MPAILAVVFFIVALIFHLAGFSNGHLDWITFALAGLVCLALAGVPAWPWHRP